MLAEPPDGFWNGSGTSTCWRLGQSNTAPAITATPMATSRPTTILAGSGSSGDGPDDRPCECEWVTRTTVEGAAACLLSVAGQEVAEPFDRRGKVAGPRQRHDA